jgi:pilus assembly protein CpaB
MSARTILGLLFILSVVAIIVVVLRSPGTTTATAPATTATILVAAKPVPVGTLLRSEDVMWQDWTGSVDPTFVLRPTAEQRQAKPDADATALSGFFGAVVRQRIETGQPITSAAVVKPGDRGFLAAVLTPDSRAVSVAVTAVSGGAGLIFPGDHVDVVLTQNFKPGEESFTHRSVSETIVRNLRVLAIDQHVQQGQTSTEAASGATPAEGLARTVTLEVLPKQAEAISVASELGKLSLILRSLDAKATPANDPDADRPTWADDVSPALHSARQPGAVSVRVMRGNSTHEAKQEQVAQ